MGRPARPGMDDEPRRTSGPPDIIDEINSLLRLGVGDQYRLEHIKLAYVENRNLWESDRRYLERMREKYLTDLRPGEPVDDDRDVVAAASEPQTAEARARAAPPPAAAPDPAGGSDAPQPDGASSPPPPGSPESAARDAEDFGADAGASEGPAVIHCWQCGKKNLLKANFCMRCGVLLFDVGNERASADSSAYASSSTIAPATKARQAGRSAAAVQRPASASGGRGSGGGGSTKRTVIVGAAALVGVLLLIAALTGSIGVEQGASDEDDADAGEAAPGAPAGEAAPGAPAAVPEPEPPAPQTAPGGRAPPPPPPDPGELCGTGTILVGGQCVPAP